MVFNVCVKCQENMSSGFKLGKPELQFMSSAYCLMAFNVCVKFHENMSSSFKSYGADTKIVNT